MVRTLYYASPLACLRLPQTSVSVYPDTGVTRIYEITFDYGGDRLERLSQLMKLERRANDLAGRVQESDPAAAAAQAATLLAEQCVWTREESTYGRTAYGALVEGSAEGEGFAMAYKAVCDLLGLECMVVSGRLDKETHAWNIVCLDGIYHHVDASQLGAGGYTGVLQNDEEMWGRYWWDIDLYPPCEGVSVPAMTGTGESSGETVLKNPSDEEIQIAPE